MNQGATVHKGCARCAALESRFLDPATPNPGAFLYAWAAHHLDEHAADPGPRPGCPECARFAAGPDGVDPRVWERWALTHYMVCFLAPGWPRAGS